MNTKSIIEKLFALIDERNKDFIELFTEDASWKIVGYKTVYGKENIIRFFENNELILHILTVDSIIADENNGSATGTLHASTALTETPKLLHFSHHYNFEDGKILSLVTFNHDPEHKIDHAARFSHLRADR